jgi:hypothetical protein
MVNWRWVGEDDKGLQGVLSIAANYSINSRGVQEVSRRSCLEKDDPWPQPASPSMRSIEH